ncbi:uncharacterized protein LOC119255709 isoform X2 [Talpa occidentalis]|uniref:uncharacterized protein LOC119255709 isoform X2 n=1 Tax=Talpa occidentalis TaxID=50954 RepID=UPI0023F8D3EE|nr:uncharacterized protein LOC119255709 isoform X2 [Talpa occidentalis]
MNVGGKLVSEELGRRHEVLGHESIHQRQSWKQNSPSAVFLNPVGLQAGPASGARTWDTSTRDPLRDRSISKVIIRNRQAGPALVVGALISIFSTLAAAAMVVGGLDLSNFVLNADINSHLAVGLLQSLQHLSHTKFHQQPSRSRTTPAESTSFLNTGRN